MSCRAEPAPVARRPPRSPRPSAPRPPGRRCAPQGGLGIGAGTSLRLPLAHSPQHTSSQELTLKLAKGVPSHQQGHFP